jgi:hypothetical protein
MINRPKLCIFHVEEGIKIQNKGTENLFNEIISENFPNLGKDMHIQVQESCRIPNRHDQKRTSLCHILVKMPKVQNKENILAHKVSDGNEEYIANWTIGHMDYILAKNFLPFVHSLRLSIKVTD